MKLSFSISVWKYALLTLGVVISMLGVVLISVGVITLGGAGSPLGAYIACFLGVLVLTLCTAGCFASLRESAKLSMLFIGLGVLTVICETAFMIAFTMMKEDFMQMTRDRVENTWKEEQVKEGAMLSIQTMYECCGIKGPQDYLKDDDDKLPPSCCRLGDCSDSGNIFSKGCDPIAVNFIDSQSDTLIITLVGLVALEALGIISAFYFGKAIKARGQKVDQIIINE